MNLQLLILKRDDSIYMGICLKSACKVRLLLEKLISLLLEVSTVWYIQFIHFDYRSYQFEKLSLHIDLIYRKFRFSFSTNGVSIVCTNRSGRRRWPNCWNSVSATCNVTDTRNFFKSFTDPKKARTRSRLLPNLLLDLCQTF